ncbi:DNA mismatch repair protein MutL [Dactylosporangium sp. CS-047395]|uniref:DNA mismatch repair protein MutL n=1 Tax=Dactylosporangium sp. CS-047395 TaxID=3239936 RepID=UPI003D8D1396
MGVERGAVPVLLWCLATTASIGVASLALRPVLRTAVPQDSIPVAADDGRGGRQAVTQTLPPPSAPATTPSTIVIEDPSSAFTHPSTPGTTRTSQAPPTQRTTAPAPRMVDGWTVTTGPDGVDVYLKSFRSDGGDAVIRIRAEVVSLVTATPRDGYSVSQAQTEPSRLVVQFVSGNGSAAFLVDCLWWQGGPHGEVTRIGN